MERKELCDRFLERLPFQTIEIKNKSFYTLGFGQDGYVWIVKKGLLISFRYSEDGKNQGISLWDESSLMGVGGLNRESRFINCYSVGKTVLGFTPAREALALLKQDNELCYEFMLYIGRCLVESYDDMEINTLGKLEDKILAFEKKLATKKLPDDASLSEVVMAMAIGAHPASVSRTKRLMNQAKREGKKPGGAAERGAGEGIA